MKRNNKTFSSFGNLSTYSNMKRKQIFKSTCNPTINDSISKTLTSSLKKNPSPNQLKKTNHSHSKKNNYITESKHFHKNMNLSTFSERNNLKKEIPKNNIEISISSVNSNENQNIKLMPSRSNSSSKNKMKEFIKSQEEILELKLQNGRLQNENKILTEKNKSLNNIIEMKSTENELLSNKYSTLISDLKQDNSNTKDKYEKDLKYYKEMNEKYNIAIKSLLNFSIEVFELLMSTSNNNISSSKNLLNHSHSPYKSNNNSTNINMGELSIDMFDINTGEEERKNVLIEQIKDLFSSKLNLIKKHLNINIDTSFFERVKDLSISKINYSNITNSIKKNNDDFNISLSKSNFNSNDISNDFDLSVSKSFYNITTNTNNNSYNNLSASPKFNSFCDNIKSENKNDLKNNNNDNNNILPLMLLSEAKSLRGSFGEYSSNSNVINKNLEQDYSKNSNKQNINILDYSIGDIVNNGNEEKNEENQEENKEGNLLNKIDSFANIKSSLEIKKNE